MSTVPEDHIDLETLVGAYLELRRALGFKLTAAERVFDRFAADFAGSKQITAAQISDFIHRFSSSVVERNKTFFLIRAFAEFLNARGIECDIPPMDCYRRLPRKSPHIFTQQEFDLILEAVSRYRSESSLAAGTLQMIFIALWCTGARIGELLRLKQSDVDLNEGLVQIAHSKFNKSRLIPLHSTFIDKARVYSAFRDEKFRPTPEAPFFPCRNGNPLAYQNLSTRTRKIFIAAGLRRGPRRNGPRLHDFRHTFAVRTLIRWHVEGRDVNALLPILSSYMGHASPASTYWYVSLCPELSQIALRRWENWSQ